MDQRDPISVCCLLSLSRTCIWPLQREYSELHLQRHLVICSAFFHILIACSLATSASFWTTDLIRIFQSNSYLNSVDTFAPARELYDFGLSLIFVWCASGIYGAIGIYLLAAKVLFSRAHLPFSGGLTLSSNFI